MRELIYTLLELEEWCSSNARCEFCSSFENRDNKAVCQIRTRTKMSGKLVSNDEVCQKCKEKFENGELPKCERCGRLQTKTYISILCHCIREKENLEEKEFPVLSDDWRPGAFYERQINDLHEQLTTAKEALEIEREEVAKFQEKSEEWGKRQKQELLDQIKELEEENKRLKESTPQKLFDEISKLKERVKQLEEQNSQLTAQVEIKEK